MALYAEKRDGNLTGVWIAEADVHGKRVRARFATQEEGRRWVDLIQTSTITDAGAEISADRKRADAGARQPLWMTVYPERRNGRLTKRWIAEARLYGKSARPRFETQTQAQQWVDLINALRNTSVNK